MLTLDLVMPFCCGSVGASCVRLTAALSSLSSCNCIASVLTAGCFWKFPGLLWYIPATIVSQGCHAWPWAVLLAFIVYAPLCLTLCACTAPHPTLLWPTGWC